MENVFPPETNGSGFAPKCTVNWGVAFGMGEYAFFCFSFTFLYYCCCAHQLNSRSRALGWERSLFFRPPVLAIWHGDRFLLSHCFKVWLKFVPLRLPRCRWCEMDRMLLNNDHIPIPAAPGTLYFGNVFCKAFVFMR